MPLLPIALILAATLVVVESAPASRLVPALLRDEGYNESWTVVAEGDGFYVYVTLAVTNLGPGDGRGICRVILRGEGRPWKRQIVSSPGAWSHEAAPVPRLALRGCELRGGASTTLTVAVDEGRLEVALPALAEAQDRLRLPGAEGAPAYREALLLEGVTATAVVTRGGERRRAVRASLLHAVARVAPDDIAKQWIWLRSRDAGDPWAALVLVGGGRTEAWVFERGSPVERIAGPPQKPARLGAAPLVLADGGTAPTLNARRELVAYEPLRDLGVFGRVLGAVVGDPLVTVHEGTWSAAGRDRSVIFESITFR